MPLLMTSEGQTDLPRYFAHVFDRLQDLRKGTVELALPDGRVFAVRGKEPGPLGRVDVITRIFSRGSSAKAIWVFRTPIWKAGGRRQICRPSWT